VYVARKQTGTITRAAVATWGAPTSIPLARITLNANGDASFDHLFCDFDQAGKPATVAYGGTFGALVPAGRR